MIADAEQPRIFHPDPRLDYYTRSDLGSEQTEQGTTEAGRRKRLAPQQWKTDEEPQGLHDA